MAYVPTEDIYLGVKDPFDAAKAQALRDNPKEIAQGTDGAPIQRVGWQPYDAVEYGDGNDGAIYDSSIDGSVSVITTPTYENGWEYKLVISILGLSNTANGLKFQHYNATTGAWYDSSTEFFSAAIGDVSYIDGVAYLGGQMDAVTRSKDFQARIYHAVANQNDREYSVARVTTPVSASGFQATRQRILLSEGAFTDGKVLLYRRGYGSL